MTCVLQPTHHKLTSTQIILVYECYFVCRYFGEKLHIDQNEKLIAFGVTHVCAIDGFSGRIVGFISMPVKSNTIIYDILYR